MKQPFTENQIDLLKEMANIGVGNAVTAISQMLNDERITMEVPVADVVPLQDVPDSFGNPERLVAATFCQANSESIHLVLVFVLPLEAAENLAEQLLPESERDNEEMKHSLLMELGNIITGSYLNALAFMTAHTFQATPPRLGIDMAGAIMGTIIAETTTVDDMLILLNTEMSVKNKGIDGSVLILPDSGSLQTIFKLLGAGSD